MSEDDVSFLAGILEQSSWLLYGNLEERFDAFVREVFQHEFKDYGFGDVAMTRDFAVAYWLFLSELVKLDLAEYGTSPRGAWLTDKGKRFRDICLGHSDALALGANRMYADGA